MLKKEKQKGLRLMEKFPKTTTVTRGRTINLQVVDEMLLIETYSESYAGTMHQRMLMCKDGIFYSRHDGLTWIVTGRIMRHVTNCCNIASQISIAQAKKVWEFWNKLHPKSQLTWHEEYENKSSRLLVKAVEKCFRYPIVVKVHEALGPRSIRIVGQYVWNTSCYDFATLQGEPPYHKCFNYEAKTVRSFLNNPSLGMYKWLLDNPVSGIRIAHMAYKRNWPYWKKICPTIPIRTSWTIVAGGYDEAKDLGFVVEFKYYTKKLYRLGYRTDELYRAGNKYLNYLSKLAVLNKPITMIVNPDKLQQLSAALDKELKELK